jgi:hypothetical protein
MTPDMRTALKQRQQLIQKRTIDVLRMGLENNEPWVRHLGPPPAAVAERRTWARHAATVAAHRDRYTIRTVEPTGPTPHTESKRTDALAAASARQALAVSATSRSTTTPNRRRPPTRGHDGLVM